MRRPHSGLHAAGRRKRLLPPRRWPRRLLVFANVVVALMLVGTGLSYGYIRYRLDAIHVVGAKSLTPAGKAISDGLAPENILLIGNQSRACLTTEQQFAQFGNPADLSGSLSDVVMIAHLDPTRRSAAVLSVPRDLFEPMPPGTPSGPYEKIDSALNDGTNGPANLITAIQGTLGIPINHYVEVNFCGFEQTVNALGGISMDFPERLFDAQSQLWIPNTGCQTISGATALALVRSRHLQYGPPGLTVADRAYWPSDPESDLARIVRDHQFLKVLITTAESQGLSNPLKLNSFLSALTNQVTMDPGLRDQLITLAAHYRNLSASSLPETTLPVTVYGNYHYGGYALGDVDFAVEPQDDSVIQAWDQGALPAPVRPSSVQVLNAVGTANLAAQTAAGLREDGFNVTATGDAPYKGQPAETLVRYNPTEIAQGYSVMAAFTGAVTMQPDSTVPPGTVIVDVGTSVTVTPPATAVPVPTSTTVAAAPATSTTTAPPTIGGAAPSASGDALTAWDPRPCP